MKKLFFFLFLLLPTVLMAQQDSTVVVTPLPPNNIWDVLMNFNYWIGSFPAMVVAVTFVAALLNGIFKVTVNIWKQVVAWTLMVVAVVVTDILNIGFAAEFPIGLAVLTGLVGGLAANGVFDIPFCKTILNKVEGWFAPKTP
jgi:hypothetical protein